MPSGGMWQHMLGRVLSRIVDPVIALSLLRTPVEGADTIVWLAASARGREHTGRLFLDRAPRRTHFLPFTRERVEERAALWCLCERYATEGGGGRERIA